MAPTAPEQIPQKRHGSLSGLLCREDVYHGIHDIPTAPHERYRYIGHVIVNEQEYDVRHNIENEKGDGQ